MNSLIDDCPRMGSKMSMNYKVRVFDSKSAFLKKELPIFEAEYLYFNDAIRGKNKLAEKKKWFVIMEEAGSKIRWIYDPKSSN